MIGRLRILWLALFVGTALVASGAQFGGTNLVFDSNLKEYVAKPGDTIAEFEFAITNVGPTAITINSVHASCGCTMPKLPPMPWVLVPGTNGSFQATVDMRGKAGTFQKTITLDTTDGLKMVSVKCVLPNNGAAIPGVDARTRNMQLASADRQIVFRNDCAACHSTPAAGKKGEALYTAACAICHEAEHRAALVTDLHALKQVPTEAYWDAWIRNGKIGTMMPAFHKDQGGPLDDEQIASLVSYLMTDFKTRKPHAPDTSKIGTMTAANQPAQPVAQIPLVSTSRSTNGLAGPRPAVRSPRVIRPSQALPGSGPLFAPPPAPAPPSPVP
jgi:mono/diheme cytochrome c family protein